MNNFTPKFPWFPNVDIYITRNKLRKHISTSAGFFSGRLLDVGCGHMPYKELIMTQSQVTEYIGMDLENSDIYNVIKPDIYWDGYNIPLANGTVDSVLLTEVLEHCPYPDKVLQEISRVLKPKGKVIFSVPFLWYLHESPWDFYRYTPFAIKKMFTDAHCSMVSLETYGDADLSFLHFYLLWLKRGKLPKAIRFGIYMITLPLILLFLAIAGNRKNEKEFENGQIYIGIVGIGEKN